jgi:hypothetical protein
MADSNPTPSSPQALTFGDAACLADRLSRHAASSEIAEKGAP